MKILKKFTGFCFVALMVVTGLALSGCNEVKPVSITSVKGLANEIVVGGVYDTLNASVKILFSNDEVKEYTSNDLTFGEVDTSTAGEKILVITFTSEKVTVTYEYPVEVYADEVVSVDVQSGFVNSVLKGEEYNAGSIVLTATYKSGKTATINEGFTVSQIDTTEVGVKTLTITYGTFTITRNVYVYDEIKVSSILNVTGVENRVKLNENLDLTNIKATILKTNGEYFEVGRTALSIGSFDTAIVGPQNLLISYTENGETVSTTISILVYEDTITSAMVVEGSYKSTINIGEEYNYSNLQLKLVYDSGDEQLINSADLEITPIDTYEEGEQNLVVSYNGEQSSVKVTVVRNYTITGFVAPSLVTEYAENSVNAEKFVETENIYLVGTDNAFKFEPSLQTAIRSNGTVVTANLTNYKANYEISLYDGNDFVTQSSFDQYLQVDELRHTLAFTENAQGKVFKISVLPKFKTENELNKINAIEFTFEVTAGYNVNNAKELSVLDNVNAGGKWTEFKNENSIDLNINVDAIILHDDIAIKSEDIPSVHIYTADEVSGAPDAAWADGSLKDRDIGYSHDLSNAAEQDMSSSGVLGAIYRRGISENSKFTVYGNYFKLSATNLPYIVRESGDVSNMQGTPVVSHTTLLTTEAESQNVLSNAIFEIKDIDLEGNSNKAEDYKKSGGLMFLKTRNVVANIVNNYSESWYMSYMFRGPQYDAVPCYNSDGELIETATLVTMKNCMAKDSYNTILYFQGAGKVELDGCEFVGAGGPVMIVDHAKAKNSGVHTGRPCFINVNNCKLESKVAGTEGWFQSMNASTLAGQIKAINNLFSAVKQGIENKISSLNTNLDNYGLSSYKITKTLNNKSILFGDDQDKLNLIAVYKSDNTAGIEDEQTASSFIVDGFANGLNLDIKSDAKYSAIDGINSAHMFIAFDGLILVPNQQANDLIYQEPYVTVDAEQAIGMAAMYGDDSLLNELISQFNALIDAYNDADTYISAVLANYMGIVLGLESK